MRSGIAMAQQTRLACLAVLVAVLAGPAAPGWAQDGGGDGPLSRTHPFHEEGRPLPPPGGGGPDLEDARP